MHPRHLLIVFLLLAAGFSLASVNTSSEYLKKPLPQPHNNYEQVVKMFLLAVDRGELVVFENTITRSMLEPQQVKYVYTLDNNEPIISIYSLLRQPIKIPGMPDCTAGGLEATLDMNGNIINSSVHISSN